jgi:hypothetical protein
VKKIIRPILILLGIIVVLFGFYAYKLHSLAIEGNKIFELRCTSVNPPLIAYKNSFLKFADYLKDPKRYKESDVKTFYDDYISGMRMYVVKENNWLDVNNKYLSQWDFKLIEPWYIKQAGELQLKMYEGYRDDAQAMLAIWDNKVTSDDLNAKQIAARKRRDDAETQYFDFFDKAVSVSDWRKIFANLPVPNGCTEENMTIPQTGGAIDWGGTPTPEPKGAPGLEGVSG